MELRPSLENKSKQKQRKTNNRTTGIQVCGECGESLKGYEVISHYDGEPCHMSCAARAMDAVFWDH